MIGALGLLKKNKMKTFSQKYNKRKEENHIQT